jgi:hypothetical protein
MPQWIEVLINICAFAGFIAIATQWGKNPWDLPR